MAAPQSVTHQFPITHTRENMKGVNSLQPHTQYTAPRMSSGYEARLRNSILDIDTFSPVNQNGSFECDRVLKSGVVQKRTRKTKAWKSIYLVLRPNSLSIYKNQCEDKLRHKIDLSDLTAVTILKDPKHKRHHIFGLFSPSRNFHLEAQSSADAREWVELIQKESRIEKEEEEMFLSSPMGNSFKSPSLEGNPRLNQSDQNRLHEERVSSSSSELWDSTGQFLRNETIDKANPVRPSYIVDYSGPEIASHSDWSDTEVSKAKEPPSNFEADDESMAAKSPSPANSDGIRNASQINGIIFEQDLERVVWQGYLLCLKSKGGVRQWKDSWIVIRCKNITFYKDESEYSPNLILPISSIINAVEIDPVSKTKKFCLQIITEEKSYRLCAHNEDTLDKCLGAIKSLLAKRRESRVK